MEPRWFGPHVAYTMAKYGMSMCVLGMAAEFDGDGIGFNALWPRTAVTFAKALCVCTLLLHTAFAHCGMPSYPFLCSLLQSGGSAGEEIRC